MANISDVTNISDVISTAQADVESARNEAADKIITALAVAGVLDLVRDRLATMNAPIHAEGVIFPFPSTPKEKTKATPKPPPKPNPDATSVRKKRNNAMPLARKKIQESEKYQQLDCQSLDKCREVANEFDWNGLSCEHCAGI